MRKLIGLACVALMASPSAFAELVAYDGFEDASVGQLNGQESGSGFTEAYTADANTVVIERSLVYTNGTLKIVGGTKAMELHKSTNGASAIGWRPLAATVDDAFYVSGLVFIDDKTKSSGNRDTVTLGLALGVGSRPHGGFGVEDTGYYWSGFIGSQGRFSTAAKVSANRTHFLVAKVFKSKAGGVYDRVSLMVDPDSASEPTTWTIANQTPGSKTGTTATVFDHLAFYMTNSLAEDNDKFVFDEIRVGLSWADVVVPYQEVAETAVDVHWTGTTAGGDWSDRLNWQEEISAAGNNAFFGGSESATRESQVAADLTVNAVSFENLAPRGTVSEPDLVTIGSEATLTLTGTNAAGRVFAVTGEPDNTSGWKDNAVRFQGGSLEIAAENGRFIVGEGRTLSANPAVHGEADFSGLKSFSANVSDFLIGFGERTDGSVRLSTGTGGNLIRAVYLGIGDADGVKGGPGTSTLTLGVTNVLQVNRLGIASTQYFGVNDRTNDQSGRLHFAEGLEDAFVSIRSRGGSGRADLVIGSHGYGADNWYYVSGEADFTGGTIDARLDDVLIAEGNSYHGSQSGEVVGIFAMSAGTVDINSLRLGLTSIYAGGRKPYDNYPARGLYRMTGGATTVNTKLEVATSDKASWKGGYQSVRGDLEIAGGTFTAKCPVVLATDMGFATGAVARVSIEGGSFTALDGIHNGVCVTNGETTVSSFDGSVTLMSGELAVTNATGTSELCLDHGTLTLDGGTVFADALVMTNGTESVITAVIDGNWTSGVRLTPEGPGAHLAGKVVITFADGFTPKVGDEWPLVSGAPVTAAFAETILPRGCELVVREDRVIFAKTKGFAVFVR